MRRRKGKGEKPRNQFVLIATFTANSFDKVGAKKSAEEKNESRWKLCLKIKYVPVNARVGLVRSTAVFQDYFALRIYRMNWLIVKSA